MHSELSQGKINTGKKLCKRFTFFFSFYKTTFDKVQNPNLSKIRKYYDEMIHWFIALLNH